MKYMISLITNSGEEDGVGITRDHVERRIESLVY